MTARSCPIRGLLALGLPLVFVTACATKSLKLEMERQVVITPPKVESISADPAGRLDTHDQDQTVKVTLRGDPGLTGSCDAIVGQQSQQVALTETQPGLYEGTFSVPQGQTGNVDLVGHLRHEPTGAHQDIREGGILQLVSVGPAPVPPLPPVVVDGGCSGEAAKRIEDQLRTFIVHFEFNRASLRPDAEAVLSSAAPVLRGAADCRIVLAGHADEIGSTAYNQALSERRAHAVESYLVTKLGIAPGVLEAMGFGESRLADTAGTPEAQRRNRRVELHLAKSP